MNMRLPFGTLRSRLATAVLAAGIAVAVAPSAMAQFGGRSGMATMFVPDFMTRDLPVFVDALQLEEWQRPILEALLDDYNTTFQTAAEGVRASMGQFRESAAGASPERVMEMISKPLVDWTAEKKKLRDDFLASVKIQLSETQIEQWPRLERAVRREKSLPNGELSGESLNLMLLFRELDAPPAMADAARAALDDYETRLDEALVARDIELESTISPLLKAMSTNDSRSGIAAQEKIMERRVAVRTVQDAGVKAVKEALGQEYGEQFEKRAMQRAFPQVYRPDPINPMIDAAESLPDLSDTQKTELQTIRAEFAAENASFQTRFADAYRVSEPREPRRRTELAEQKASGAAVKFSEAPEIETSKKEREELYTKYRVRIAGVLNDAQKEAIPGMGKPGADIPDGQTYSQAIRSDAKSRGDDAPADDANPKQKGLQAPPSFSAPNPKGGDGSKGDARDLGATRGGGRGNGGGTGGDGGKGQPNKQVD